MLKKYISRFKPFLLLISVLCTYTNDLDAIMSGSATYTSTASKLANYLNAITVANTSTLSDFNNNVISPSTFSSSSYQNEPTSSNSIYTKLKFFYDARTTQNAAYQTALYNVIVTAKSKSYLTSSQKTDASTWYTTVGNEITLLSNFASVLSGCTTPNLLLANVVQQNSYNVASYQDYPSTSNSIFYKIQTFYQTRTANMQTNISYLQNILDLLNASLGKKFLTPTENSQISGFIATVSQEKTKLDATFTKLQNYLAQYANDPVNFYNYIVADATFNFQYFQNYPSTVNSIYISLNQLYLNRETSFANDKTFLTNLDKLLSNASTKLFLTAAQQSDVLNWDNSVKQDLALVANFNTALQAAMTADILNTIVTNPSYNRILFQNCPDTNNSIFAKSQNFYTQRAQTSTYLTSLLTLLVNLPNKNFLTSPQNASVNSWITTVGNELNTASINTIISKLQTSLSQFQNDPISLYNYVVADPTFNLAALQNKPSSTNSIYTALNQLNSNREINFITDKNFLTNLETLLSNASTKLFLTPAQQSDVVNWDNIVRQDLALIYNFNSTLQAATTIDALNLLVQSTNYNRTLFQNYPDTSNSIFAKAQNIFNQRTQTSAYLSAAQTLFGNLQNKNFITTTQKASISSWITTIANELNNLSNNTLISKLQTLLSQYQNDPVNLYNYVIADSTFNSTSLQNIPSSTFSIYTTLKQLNTNREIGFTTDKNFLVNLEKLLSTASTKQFLTATQQNDVESWDNTAKQDLALISNFTSAIQAANTVETLNMLAQNATYNRVLFQNYPDTSSSIFAKTQTLVNDLTQNLTSFSGLQSLTALNDLSSLTKLQALVKNIRDKNFLTSNQQTSANSWYTAITNGINAQAASTSTTTPTTAVGGSTSTTPTTSRTTSASSSTRTASPRPTTSTQTTTTPSIFVFDSAVYGQDKVVYNSTNWTTPVGYQGNFAIKFKAKGQKELYVQLSPGAGEVVGNVYHLVIGGDSNTSTWVRNATTDSGTITGAKISSSNSMITGGLPGDGSTWDDYWVKIVGNKDLSWGKSTTIGTNEIAHWTFTQQTSAPVQYFAFGSYSSTIQISDVKIAGIAPAKSTTTSVVKTTSTTDDQSTARPVLKSSSTTQKQEITPPTSDLKFSRKQPVKSQDRKSRESRLRQPITPAIR